jgi:hypothetical protein
VAASFSPPFLYQQAGCLSQLNFGFGYSVVEVNYSMVLGYVTFCGLLSDVINFDQSLLLFWLIL